MSGKLPKKKKVWTQTCPHLQRVAGKEVQEGKETTLEKKKKKTTRGTKHRPLDKIKNLPGATQEEGGGVRTSR